MEPTSFNVGDQGLLLVCSEAFALQWSRRLSTSETLLQRWLRLRTPRFNGADVFQRRRPDSCTDHRRKDKSFNGADVFQRRRPCIFQAGQVRSLTLQWSRRLSTSETFDVAASVTAPESLQWSRRLSTSETTCSCFRTT